MWKPPKTSHSGTLPSGLQEVRALLHGLEATLEPFLNSVLQAASPAPDLFPKRLDHALPPSPLSPPPRPRPRPGSPASSGPLEPGGHICSQRLEKAFSHWRRK